MGALPNRQPEPIKPEWKDPADPTKEYTWDHFDLVRVEHGKIQEHWDEAQKNPPALGR